MISLYFNTKTSTRLRGIELTKSFNDDFLRLFTTLGTYLNSYLTFDYDTLLYFFKVGALIHLTK